MVAATAALLMVAGCSAAHNGPPDTDETAGQTLRVGIKYNQPGIGLMDGDKTPTGFDVDVAAYIAWKLGYSPYDIEWVRASTGDRETLLLNDEVDMVVASYTITDERRGQIDFAGPYLTVGQDIMVRADNTTITGPEGLAGKIACEPPLSANTTRLKDLLGDKVTIIEERNYLECARHVVDGTADATSTDDFILAGLAATDELFGQVRLLGVQLSEDQWGIGLPKGSHDVCVAVNEALTEMVEDGSWQRFIDRHTGGTDYKPSEYKNPPALTPCAMD
jgi:glutamate transport system substrate-binding protein